MRISKLAFYCFVSCTALSLIGGDHQAAAADGDFDPMNKGYGIKPTGLKPVYPSQYDCSPLTSLYASWVDVDGSHRDEIHTGVDGGRFGEWIRAPAAGTVRAAWEANWQWGREGSLLLVHSRNDVNLDSGPEFYYSEFDHLDYADIRHFAPGQRIERGQILARVSRPGGQPGFLPEVHWEVWEVDADRLNWKSNKFNAPVWHNKSAILIDPLYMLGLNKPPIDDFGVQITPFEDCSGKRDCRGFTYILPCNRK